MRLCLMIEGQEGVSWQEWLALAQAAEAAGFEGLFRSDHYNSVFGVESRGSLDAWATLAALAAVTERIRLGVLVSPATFRHPSQLARVVATVDHISGGRVELGLGAGWNEREHAAFGFPFPGLGERLDVLAEQLEIVHRQWTEEEFSFDGRHYRLVRCSAEPKPLQQPRPPLVLGGSAGPRALALAARFADEYDVIYRTPEECRELRDRLREACRATGRGPIPLSLMTLCVVGRDEAELAARLARVDEVRAGADGTLPGLPGTVVGTVDQVVVRLREYEAAGVERVYLQLLAHDDLDMVRLIGQEILPALAG